MKTYLVGFSVTNAAGSIVSNGFIEHDGPVTPWVITLWQNHISGGHQELEQATIRIFTFQEIAP